MSSTTTSRNASITSPQKGRSNLSKAWTAIKTHHEEMNAAYAAFYSPGSSRANSAAPSRANSITSPRHSSDEVRHEPKGETNLSKHWKALKNRAVEHHRGVNAAYRAAYGAGF